MNLFNRIKKDYADVACVLVDEAQFLTKEQVDQLSDVVDFLDIPVLAYGLRSDFRGKSFEGSERLLAIADILEKFLAWRSSTPIEEGIVIG